MRVERDLYFFEYVDRPQAEVLDDLLEPGHSYFQAASDSAAAEADRFKSRLHVDVMGFEIGRDVKIELGQPVDKGYGVSIPIKWRSASDAALFPSMDAELEVVSLSDAWPLTQLSLIGRYRPPMGVLGAVGNAMVGHSVAEAAVRHFIVDLAAQLKRAEKPAK